MMAALEMQGENLPEEAHAENAVFDANGPEFLEFGVLPQGQKKKWQKKLLQRALCWDDSIQDTEAFGR